jgi:N-acyl-D-amino-acid deacylase
VHDLVIRGGQIIDGSGRPARVGDVAIDGERIVEAGGRVGAGRREIDADGLIVTPGWVDIHTHYVGQVTWDPEVSPSGWHGVTTVVMGNCGVGFAPAQPQEHDWLIQLMEGVEDIPGSALAEGITWNWVSFPDYLDEVERMPRVMDVAAMIPHGALRAFVLGCDRNNDTATTDEIALMAKLTREAVDAGAVGFSTTRSLGHRAKDGQSAAGTFADPGELLALGSALRDAGRRVFAVVSDHNYVEGPDADAEYGWMAQLSGENRVPVTYMLHDVLQVPGDPSRPAAPGGWRRLLERGLELNRDGAWLVPQVAGKPASVMVGWESSYHLFSTSPAYQPLAGLPIDKQVAQLRQPDVRQAILNQHSGVQDPFASLLHAQLEAGNLFPLGDPPDYEPGPEKSLKAIAERQGRPPIEVAYDLMLERNGRELLYWPLTAYTSGNLDGLREMLIHPSTVLGLADGGAHVGIICDGAVPTFMLTHWARDRSRGERIPLEKVVHLQTQRTADLYGFCDRGRIAAGYLADINVIDFERLALAGVEMAYDLPGGAKRLIQSGRGYMATVKSGRVVRENDHATREYPGRLLRGPQLRPAENQQ